MTGVVLVAGVVNDVATCLVRKRSLEGVIVLVVGKSVEVLIMDASMPASNTDSGG